MPGPAEASDSRGPASISVLDALSRSLSFSLSLSLSLSPSLSIEEEEEEEEQDACDDATSGGAGQGVKLACGAQLERLADAAWRYLSGPLRADILLPCNTVEPAVVSAHWECSLLLNRCRLSGLCNVCPWRDLPTDAALL